MPSFPPPSPEPLFADLADPDLSLHAVAARHGATLADLILWLTSPDVAAKLDAFKDACAGRARLVAATLLPSCALTLQAIADAQMAEAETLQRLAQQQAPNLGELQPGHAHAPPAPPAPPTTADTASNFPTNLSANAPARSTGPRDHALRTALLRTRAHESARRAIAMILRIARWHDPRPQTHHAASRLASSPLSVTSTSSRCATRSHTPAWERAASSGQPAPSEPSLGHNLESLLAALASARRHADTASASSQSTTPSQRAKRAEAAGARRTAVATHVVPEMPVPRVDRAARLPVPDHPNPPAPHSIEDTAKPIFDSPAPPLPLPNFKPQSAARALLGHAGAAASTTTTRNSRAGPAPPLSQRRRSA